MKTLSQICTDAAQALMVRDGYIGLTLQDAGATYKQRIGIGAMLRREGLLGDAIDKAADALGWSPNDFRIFLLLNAAEALK